MRRSLWKTERVSDEFATLEPSSRRRNTLSLLGSISIGCQFGLSQRRLGNPETSVFHEQGTSWSRREIILDRKTSIFPGRLDVKAKLYFQVHAMRVLTEYPMKKVLQKPDLSGKLVNWAIELGQFDIEFHPRTSIKGQALADFLVEFSNTPESEELPKEDTWVAYVDGSSANQKSRVGVMITSLKGENFSIQ
jgi:hypothetical protein